MNCKKIETLLIGYIDDRLNQAERAAVDSHAKTCAPCAERLQGFGSVFATLDSWKEIEPSPSFNRRLEQRLAEEAANRSWWRNAADRWIPFRFGMPAYAMAMLMVVVVGGVALRYSSRYSSPYASPYSSGDNTQAIATNADRPPVVRTVSAGAEELALYRNLPVLEDLDVLGDFEVLQELDTPNTVAQ